MQVEKVKANDFVEIAGWRLRPTKLGVFSMTVKSIDQVGIVYKLTFVNGDKTEWLPFNMELKPATTDLDYSSIPASRQQSKTIGGKGIE